MLAVVAVTALGGFLRAAPQGHAAVAAVTADAGYRDFSFGGSAPAPTAKDQQSKLWFNDGVWWGSLFNSSTLKYHIHKLDSATQVWSDTGTVIDERDGSRSDAFSDGATLYVVTHGTTATTADHSIRLMRFTYNSSTKTYSTDAGFPVTLNTGGTQAATIEKDTTGQLWVSYTQTSKVYVTHSTTSASTWVTPYVLPVNDTANLLDQDESAIVSFNGKIGVMWSNQNAAEWAYYFATHVDGAADTAWTKTTAHQGSEESDNHLNVKGLDGDAAGQVFAAVKTSLNAADAPLYYLLVLGNDGQWTRQTFGTVADDHTRAQVALDPVNRRLYMFGTSPCCSGGSIYYKDTSLDSPSFGSGKGTPLIQNATDTHINNPSTTKQPLTTDTELVVEASDDTSNFYVHATIDIGPDVTPPDTTISSGPSGTVAERSASFTFTANEGGSTFACSLDGAAFASCTSPKAYTGLADGSHTFEVRATDPVGNLDPSPASRTWTIDTSTQTLTVLAAADAYVEQGKPTTNFGTSGLLTADNSPNTETFIRFAPVALAGPIVEAKLRLFVSNGTNNGPALYRSDTAWSETGVTWNTRPATVGPVIEDKGAIPNRTWAEYDVDSVVTGNGTYSFRLGPTSTDGVDFYSRDSTNANKPQLVLTIDNDTIAPETTIASGPSGTVNSTSATFTFSSNEPGATFRCSLDGAVYSTCSSPQSYSNLAQGPHTFDVRAVDPAGNEDATPASRAWSIDTGAPAAPVITSPPDNSTNTTGSITVSGTAEPGTSVQTLDGASLAGTATADGAGLWTLALTNVADGSHTFTATATDAAGNTSPASNARTVTVDSTAPETTIDSGPTGGPVSETTAAFAFSSDEAGATFECRLDAGAYAPCTSPMTYNALDQGSHSFDVRATDAAGNSDVTPAGRAWSVDSIAPAAPVIASPADNSTSTTASVTVSGTGEPGVAIAVFDGVTSVGETAADGLGLWSVTVNAVSDGAHTYSAAATDAAGNASASSNTATVTVDTLAPQTTLDAGPTGTTTDTSATFSFSSDDAGATFACRLDGGAYSPCTSPKTYDSLSDGSHTFQVRAEDVAGNADPTPAERTWIVDDAPPPAPAITSPPDGSLNSTGSITLSGMAEAATTVELFEGATSQGTATATGGGLWSVTVSGVTDGSHTYTATATDAAGNTSAASDGVTVTVDTSAPDTTIDSGPSGSEPSSTATFTFSSSETGSTFECSLDGSDFASCDSSVTYNDQSEGPHSFAVRATDAAGNVDLSPATRDWTVDATVPTVTAVVPAEGASDVLVNTDVTATFSEAMDAASITTTTFALVVQATGTAVTADVEYDALSRTATLDPDSSLLPATTYLATVVGGASGVKDLAGSGLETDKAWSFTTEAVPDATPPQTTIDSGPSGLTGSSAANFAFSSDEAGSTFQCSLDGAAFASCTSPHSYAGLAEGSHTFEVRATDVAGNEDPTPAARTWTVDTQAPAAPSIVSPPDGATNSSGVTVSGSAEGQSTVEVFDGATSVGTTTAAVGGGWSLSLTGVADGAHVYTAKATDAAGNTSAASNARTVTVDTGAPETTIVSGPGGLTALATAEFAFSSSESGSSFECSLDEAPFAACTSPKSYAGLGEGSHSFAVRATDAAGNEDASADERSWTVDTTAPAAPALTAPANNSTSTSATIVISGTAEPAATVEVFDGGAPQGTTTADGAGAWSKTLEPVSDGSHTYTAKATDAAGNTSSSSNSRTVTVDATAPETTIDSGPTGTTTSTSASFTFSANDPAATFACSLDGAAFAACTSPQSYTGLSEAGHTFAVRAADALGNTDATPATRAWTINLALFSDGFESGDFSSWTTLLTGGDGTAVVQGAIVKTGSFAAKLTETATAGSFAYARKTFDPRTELRVKGDFQIQLEGASGGNVPLIRLFDTAGTRIVSLYRQNLDSDKIRITHSGVGVTTTGRLALNTWAQIELHVIVAGTASTIEVFQNGALVYQTTTASLGTNAASTVQIGNETKAQAFTLVADDVTVRP